MTIAFDIGNSDITIGIHDNQTWVNIWRLPSAIDQTELFYGLKIREYFFEQNIDLPSIDKVVVSSVVPVLNDKIENVIRTLFGRDPLVLGPDVYKKFPIKILNPYEIGSDLVSNALAAFTKYESNCIVVDFGTALTFTVISKSGEVLGVAIAPGLKTAIKSLSQNTAKLFDVPLEFPTSVIGKNTVHAIQAGVLGGYEGLVREMISKIKQELHDVDCKVVATGGLSSIINSLSTSFDDVEPNLTLEGLRIATEY